ncbi:MAG: hypothetical protein QOG55_719, partial [Acidobacteriaceae bacterium]|nr:hypothetical protein [Acidobacteriaceae bacterium]
MNDRAQGLWSAALGLLEALERQEQDEAARELSFLDRLALLVDQQWNWRQNQALAR